MEYIKYTITVGYRFIEDITEIITVGYRFIEDIQANWFMVLMTTQNPHIRQHESELV